MLQSLPVVLAKPHAGDSMPAVREPRGRTGCPLNQGVSRVGTVCWLMFLALLPLQYTPSQAFAMDINT